MVLAIDPAWLQRLSGYRDLWVGYSGGLDSSVLLSLLVSYPQLRAKIKVIHVHHGLSPNADQWVLHCQRYCEHLQVPLRVEYVSVALGSNLEERARLARYHVFESLLQAHDAVVLAHHQTDQSETVLLNMLRGAGVDGLGAMAEQRACGHGVVLRPLLSFPKTHLQSYAHALGMTWIDDETNDSDRWSRAYLRAHVMPMLRARWPAVEASLVACADHCRQAQQHLNYLAHSEGVDFSQLQLTIPDELLGSIDHSSSEVLRPARRRNKNDHQTLSNHARLSNVLRVWFKHHLHQAPSAAQLDCVIHELLLAKPDAQPLVCLGAWSVRRYRNTLYLLPKDRDEQAIAACVWQNFPDPLALSTSQRLLAKPKRGGLVIPSTGRIEIRSRQGGETFRWRGQTKSLKVLFQEWGIPPWKRVQIPLLYVNARLMAIVGYAEMDSLQEDGYTIELQTV